MVSVGEARKGQWHLEGGLEWGESWQGTDASRLNGSRKETLVNSRWEKAELQVLENSEEGTAKEKRTGLPPLWAPPQPNFWVRRCLGSPPLVVLATGPSPFLPSPSHLFTLLTSFRLNLM